jgi:hypothetical protein
MMEEPTEEAAEGYTPTLALPKSRFAREQGAAEADGDRLEGQLAVAAAEDDFVDLRSALAEYTAPAAIAKMTREEWWVTL